MYRQISENFDQQKKREHEYKNEMMVISSLLKQNEMEKLHTLLDKYNAEIAHRMDAIDTNHVIVNAILNTKHQEAREKGIVFVLLGLSAGLPHLYYFCNKILSSVMGLDLLKQNGDNKCRTIQFCNM